MNILLLGESGSGKTSSLCCYLNAQSTYYFDCDMKGLNIRNWRDIWSTNNKNYLMTNDLDRISRGIEKINTNAPHIKTIVIDTINGVMVNEEMKRSKEKGFDKWTELASNIYNLIMQINNLRPDLNVIMVGHSITESDENGYFFTRMRTAGKMLDKLVVESKFSCVILSKFLDGQYVYQIKTQGFDTVKTPLGAFDGSSVYIPNNITIVLDALKGY